MKTVKIYDNYTSTLMHQCTGYTTVHGEGLTQNQAINLVEDLYNESKTLGDYINKIIKLDEGYAELKIQLDNTRTLNRVIYMD